MTYMYMCVHASSFICSHKWPQAYIHCVYVHVYECVCKLHLHVHCIYLFIYLSIYPYRLAQHVTYVHQNSKQPPSQFTPLDTKLMTLVLVNLHVYLCVYKCIYCMYGNCKHLCLPMYMYPFFVHEHSQWLIKFIKHSHKRLRKY